jgi:hypothetical protein
MAVISGVTVMPNARIAGMALAGLHSDEAVAAVRKTFEHDGGTRVLGKQKDGRGHKSQEPLFHRFSHISKPTGSKPTVPKPNSLNAQHCTALIFAVDEFCPQAVVLFVKTKLLQRHPAKPRWIAYATLCKLDHRLGNACRCRVVVGSQAQRAAGRGERHGHGL